MYTRVRVHDPSLLGNLLCVYFLLSTVHYVPLPQAVMTKSMISVLSCQFPPSVGPRLAGLIPTVTGGHWATPAARGCVGLGGLIAEWREQAKRWDFLSAIPLSLQVRTVSFCTLALRGFLPHLATKLDVPMACGNAGRQMRPRPLAGGELVSC